MSVVVTADAGGGKVTSFTAVVRIDTPDEADYYAMAASCSTCYVNWQNEEEKSSGACRCCGK